MDLIRSGKVPEVIRRKGATGNLPLPSEDKIEILALLATAPDADLRAKTLWKRCKDGTVRKSAGLWPARKRRPRCCVSRRSNLPEGHEELREILLWNPSLPVESRALLQRKPTAATLLTRRRA